MFKLFQRNKCPNTTTDSENSRCEAGQYLLFSESVVVFTGYLFLGNGLIRYVELKLYSNFAQKSGDTKGVPSPLTIEVADKASRLTDTRNA